jgi:acyl dehydratase
MPINASQLLQWPIPDQRTPYTRKDAILYALSLGYGADPLDQAELPFVHEAAQRVAPTLTAVLGAPGPWARDPGTGIDWRQILHGEHRMRFLAPLAPEGVLLSRTRVTHVIDKGPGRGALVITHRDVADERSGELVASVQHTSFCRADGGHAIAGDVAADPPSALPSMPDVAPDAVVSLATPPSAALLYRLNGDDNPIHADPEAARQAGFDRPILHGLCTYGMAARAVLRAFCDNDPVRLKGLALRFSAPFFPGETLRVELWRRGPRVHFMARSTERDIPVLTHGLADVE